VSAVEKLGIGPYRITVPAALVDDFDEMVDLVARRTGERADDVRRGVEQAVLARGLASLRSDEGWR
jgi:hypothetical protein